MPDAVRIAPEEHDRLLHRAVIFSFTAGAFAAGIGAAIVALALYGWAR